MNIPEDAWIPGQMCGTCNQPGNLLAFPDTTPGADEVDLEAALCTGCGKKTGKCDCEAA